MKDELKVYSYSKNFLYLCSLNVVLAVIATIMNLMIPNIIFNFTSILWVMVALVWLGHVVHDVRYPFIATTKNTIAVSRGAFRRIHGIKISDIIKIERESLTKLIIWYKFKFKKTRKQEIDISMIEKGEQINFNKYIENLIESKNIPVA